MFDSTGITAFGFISRDDVWTVFALFLGFDLTFVFILILASVGGEVIYLLTDVNVTIGT